MRWTSRCRRRSRRERRRDGRRGHAGADDVDRRLVAIRPAEAADVPQLAKLHAEAMQAGMALGAAPGADLDALERSHRDALGEPARVVLVAELEGELVGMAQLSPSGAANAPHRAEVQRVAVAERVRGQGVGRQLMAAVEDAAREHGLTLLWLTTHDGSAACAFYDAVGYTKLGVMPSYSLRPDGTVSPAAFYFKELRRSS